jgi:hypothetical protein
MCKKETYKRFKRIHDYIQKNGDICTPSDDSAYKYVRFNTKLGSRAIISSIMDKTLYLGYHDFDDSLLFTLSIEKSGRVKVVQSEIDKIAIFSAIYEIECIIHDKKSKKMDDILDKLFSNTNEYPFTFYR